jgi:hypothetical protein
MRSLSVLHDVLTTAHDALRRAGGAGTFRIASSPSQYGHSAGALGRTECAFSCMILPPCAFDAIATTVRKSPRITDCAVH